MLNTSGNGSGECELLNIIIYQNLALHLYVHGRMVKAVGNDSFLWHKHFVYGGSLVPSSFLGGREGGFISLIA